MTRSRVSGAIGTLVGVPLSTRDTVLWETSAAAAMSRIVVTCRTAGRADGSTGSGASSDVDPGPCLLSVIPVRLARIRLHSRHPVAATARRSRASADAALGELAEQLVAAHRPLGVLLLALADELGDVLVALGVVEVPPVGV